MHETTSKSELFDRKSKKKLLFQLYLAINDLPKRGSGTRNIFSEKKSKIFFGFNYIWQRMTHQKEVPARRPSALPRRSCCRARL